MLWCISQVLKTFQLSSESQTTAKSNAEVQYERQALFPQNNKIS